jgi:drug/metabolite transporter (DMT)-like permease
MSGRRFYVVGFGILMSFDTLTQVSLKLASNHAGEFRPAFAYLLDVLRQPWIYSAAAGYLGAFVTWMTLLKRSPVGPAFAASHLEVVAVLVLSALLFNERLGSLQAVGCACIILGIVCLAVSESKRPHA